MLQFSFFPYDRESKILNHTGCDDVTKDCLIIFDKGLHNQEKNLIFQIAYIYLKTNPKAKNTFLISLK